MIMKTRTLFTVPMLAICVSLALGACSYRLPQQQVVAESDHVTLRLAEAADRAAQALETLSAIENQRTPARVDPLVDDVPQDLRRSLTVKWAGPIGPIAEAIAARIGYRYASSGNTPEIPVIVTVDARQTPAVKLLRDIGYQMGKRGELVVDPMSKTIEVVYAAAHEDY